METPTQTDLVHEPDALVKALGATPRAMIRDSTGWVLYGRKGLIRTIDQGWLVYVLCGSTRHWTQVQRALPFCEPVEPGILRLRVLPDPAQAAHLQRYLRIPKRHELSTRSMALVRDRLSL